jgi:hypothetical protein
LDRGSENVFSESILSGQLLSQGNAAQDGISDDELNNLVPLLNTGAGASELDFAADDGAIPSALVDVAMHGTVDVSGSTASENQAETSDDQNVMAMGSAVAADEDTKPKEIRIKWKPGLKPFRRQDAYYVCNGCAAKYFSKVEAEKCFASHPMDMPNKPAGS